MTRQRLRILICDTDAETLIDLEQILENAGFDTTTTWDAVDFARLLEESSYHLLIIGDHPPQIDAEAIVDGFRSRRPASDVACLVLEADPRTCEIQRIRSAGAIAVLSRRDYISIVKQVEFFMLRRESELRTAA